MALNLPSIPSLPASAASPPSSLHLPRGGGTDGGGEARPGGSFRPAFKSPNMTGIPQDFFSALGHRAKILGPTDMVQARYYFSRLCFFMEFEKTAPDSYK